jgi:hypothetical protein
LAFDVMTAVLERDVALERAYPCQRLLAHAKNKLN